MTQAFRLIPFGGLVIKGEGAPTSTTGIVGNLYLDTLNARLYGPKTEGGWGTDYIELNPEGDVVYKGEISASANEPSPKKVGHLYTFNTNGWCSWLNANVKAGEAIFWNGTEWIRLQQLKIRGVAQPDDSVPSNSQDGEIWVFNSTGINTWSGSNLELKTGSLALRVGNSWHFNNSSPEWAVYVEQVGVDGTNSLVGYRGKAVTLAPGPLHSTWLVNWPGGSPTLNRRTLSIHDGQQWITLQPLLPKAGESYGGWVQLATQAETNAGTDNEKVVTPAKLKNYKPDGTLNSDNSRLARIFRKDINLLSGSTGNIIAHNLNCLYPLVNCYEIGNPTQMVLVDVEIIDANHIKIITSVSFNAVVVVVG